MSVKLAVSFVFVTAFLLISIVSGDSFGRAAPARGDELSYTITMDAGNAPTTSETYTSVEADIRYSHFEYVDAKASSSNHVELNTAGYIINSLDSQITSILSVTAVFSTAGYFNLETSYYGFDLFTDPVSLTSETAYDLSTSLPYYLRFTAADASVTITSVTIIYSCSPHEAPLEAGENYYLGSFPQTKVTNSTLVTTLNTVAGTLPTSENSQTWTSYQYYISGYNTTDFMWYKDVTNGEDKYRGVYFTSYRPNRTDYESSTSNSYQDDNGYLISTRYWFKYEPIKWDVLFVDETTGFLSSDMLIDSREYYHSPSNRTIGEATIYANNYKESNIRIWLNNDFYNQAFSITEQSSINTTTVDNSVASTGYASNPYACENTNDKMFLLSYVEANNDAYGLSTFTSRRRQATDYAKAMGVYVTNDSSPWWLRSPHDSYVNLARFVDSDGWFYSFYIYNTYYGVLPTFRINL